jgi:hypothetical protein
MTLAEALGEAATDLPGATPVEIDDGVEWRVDDRTFAVVRGTVVELQLAPVVARAALGTPDTQSSRRGRGWVAFAPPVLDQFALDRAVAWFASAYRLVAG